MRPPNDTGFVSDARGGYAVQVGCLQPTCTANPPFCNGPVWTLLYRAGREPSFRRPLSPAPLLTRSARPPEGYGKIMTLAARVGRLTSSPTSKNCASGARARPKPSSARSVDISCLNVVTALAQAIIVWHDALRQCARPRSFFRFYLDQHALHDQRMLAAFAFRRGWQLEPVSWVRAVHRAVMTCAACGRHGTSAYWRRSRSRTIHAPDEILRAPQCRQPASFTKTAGSSIAAAYAGTTAPTPSCSSDLIRST